jgi:hypothetical protein
MNLKPSFTGDAVPSVAVAIGFLLKSSGRIAALIIPPAAGKGNEGKDLGLFTHIPSVCEGALSVCK